MLTQLYRKYIPQSFRDYVYKAILWNILNFSRNFKLSLKCKSIRMFGFLLPKTEENRLYSFMGRHGITSIPHEFALKYRHMQLDIPYYFDSEWKLPYVMHNEKRLYFPSKYPPDRVKGVYANLLTEQDNVSPHRYVKSYDILNEKTVLDIGAAEGIFSLEVIDTVSHVYLFECEEHWVEALEATFAPWKNKIDIIKKYVSDIDDDKHITIDTFLKDKNIDNLFLKMDIEGFEQKALQGASTLLKNGINLDCSICTYHRKEDFEIIYSILKNAQMECETTEGYMFYNNGFQKAMVRGSKVVRSS